MAELTENQLKWKAHIDAASKAGQSLAEYARSRDLDLKRLYSYSRVIRLRQKPASKTKFVRVRAAPAPAPSIRIELVNGVRVHVGATPDLGALLQTLAKLP